MKNYQNLLIHPETLKPKNFNFFPYKMNQKTCKNFQKWIFSKKAQNLLKNAQNLLIHPENEKSKNLYFPIQNGSKHLKIFQK